MQPIHRQRRCTRLAAAAMLVCLALLSPILPSCRAGNATNELVRVAFNSQCEPLLLSQLARARKEVLVAIYSITQPSIVSALIEAHTRGARVKVKYDAKQADYEGMQDALRELKKHGIECRAVWMAEKRASMHDKFMVIDGSRVLTGSYNYTVQASEINDENLVLIDLPAIARDYAAAFDAINSR